MTEAGCCQEEHIAIYKQKGCIFNYIADCLTIYVYSVYKIKCYWQKYRIRYTLTKTHMVYQNNYTFLYYKLEN